MVAARKENTNWTLDGLSLTAVRGGGMCTWWEPVGPEVNAVTSCHLPPKVVSITLSYVKYDVFFCALKSNT